MDDAKLREIEERLAALESGYEAGTGAGDSAIVAISAPDTAAGSSTDASRRRRARAKKAQLEGGLQGDARLTTILEAVATQQELLDAVQGFNQGLEKVTSTMRDRSGMVQVLADRLNKLEERHDVLEGRHEQLEKQLVEVNEENTAICGSLVRVIAESEDLKAKVARLESQLDESGSVQSESELSDRSEPESNPAYSGILCSTLFSSQPKRAPLIRLGEST